MSINLRFIWKKKLFTLQSNIFKITQHMGNCTNPVKKSNKKQMEAKNKNVRSASSSIRKVNLPKLLNFLRSSEIDLIDEKIQQVCVNEKKKLLNYQLFLQLFLNLQKQQKTFGSTNLRSFFQLFDQTKDGYIDPREIINGIALVLFIEDNRFGEILAEIFNLANSNVISQKKFEEFKKNNTSFLLEKQMDKNEDGIHEDITLQFFCQYIKRNYKISKYRQLFDLFETHLEYEFIQNQQEIQKQDDDEVKIKNVSDSIQQRRDRYEAEDALQTNTKIKSYEKQINNEYNINQQGNHLREKVEQSKLIIKAKENQSVFLVDIKWFNAWRLYLKRYDVIQIEFVIEGTEWKDKQNKFKLSIDELKDKSKYVRPSKFQNYQLFGEYQGELKYKLEIKEKDHNRQLKDKYLDLEKKQQKLEIFKDFVIFPRNIWQVLKKIYRGGPDIERKVLHFYPIFLYRVETEKGIFVKQKIIKYVVSNSNTFRGIFKDKDVEDKIMYLTQTQISDEQKIMRWRMADFDEQIPQDQKQRAALNHQFFTLIPKSQQRLFQTNYVNPILNNTQNQLVTNIPLLNNFNNLNNLNVKNKNFLVSYGQYLKIKVEKVQQKNVLNIDNKEDEVFTASNINGEIFKFLTSDDSKKYSWGRVMQLKKEGVKVHFLNKSYGCDYVFTYKQIQHIKQSMENSGKQLYTPKIRNIIPGFRKKIKIAGNQLKLSYLFSVVQCLIATPYFLEFLIKKKFKYNVNKNLNFNNTILKELAYLAMQSKDLKSEIAYEDFYYRFLKKAPQFNEQKKGGKEFLPDQFLVALLNQIDSQIKQSIEHTKLKLFSKQKQTKGQQDSDKEKQNDKQKIKEKEKQTTNLNENQNDIEHQLDSNNNDAKQNKLGQDEGTNNQQQQIIKKFFQFQGNSTTSCIECATVNIEKDISYILNLKINQDDQVLFTGYFYPWMHRAERKNKIYEKHLYGATMKLSKQFNELAYQFLFQIRKDYSHILGLKNLHFALEKSGEFRKHFEGQDFKSTLHFLNLKKDHCIMIYQVREIISDTIEQQGQESQYQISVNQIESREIQKFRINQKKIKQEFQKKNNEFRKYEYVDYKIYLDWQVAQFLQKDGKYSKIKNYEYREPARIESHKILPLGTKTSQKQSITIEIIHRKQQQKKIKRDLQIKPFIICLKQLTKINDIERVIKHEMARYHALSSSYKGKLTEIHKKALERMKSSVNQQFQFRKIKRQDYQIKYLKKMAGDACYFCGKKSRIITKLLNKSENIEAEIDRKKYCYGEGCSELTAEIRNAPIGCYVDLKKLFIAIDWKVQVIQNSIKEHESFKSAKNYIDNHFTTIQECFKLLQGKSDKDYICKSCKYVEASCRKYITCIPNILIIKLQRFIKSTTGIQKLDNKIQIKEQISLATITNPVNNQDLYELYAIICHKGANLQQGSWYSYVLKSRRYWIKCDDNLTYCEDVKLIEHSQICMLFYRRKNIEGYLVSLVT